MIRIYSFLIQPLTTLCYKNILWKSRRWNEDELRRSTYNHHQGSTNHQDPPDHLVGADLVSGHRIPDHHTSHI